MGSIKERDPELGELTASIASTMQGCSLSGKGTLPHPSRLLAANTLKSGPVEERALPTRHTQQDVYEKALEKCLSPVSGRK